MRAPRRALACAACIAAGAAGTGVRADVLVGPHGERLPGTLVERRADVIVFQSDFLGRIEVPASQAHVEADDATPVVAVAPSAGVPPAAAATSGVAGGAWAADLGAKLAVDRGSLKSREDRLDASLKIVHRGPRGELNTALDYKHKRTDGVLKHDDWAGSLAYDRFVGTDRFVAGRLASISELATDGTNETDTLAIAYGWRLLERPNRYLRLGPAIGYVSLSRGDSRISGPAVGLYARGRGPWLARTGYEYELQALDTLSDGRYATLDLRWRKPLGERLYLALVWRYIWSDVEIESGFTSEWRWDIGWRFGPADPH